MFWIRIAILDHAFLKILKNALGSTRQPIKLVAFWEHLVISRHVLGKWVDTIGLENLQLWSKEAIWKNNFWLGLYQSPLLKGLKTYFRNVWNLNIHFFIKVGWGAESSKLFKIALPINKLCDSAKFSYSA